MDYFRQVGHRVAGLFRRQRREIEMAEEMRQHLERRVEEKIAEGLTSEAARYAAQREFGGLAQLQEQCRDERRFAWFEQAGQDLHYAARQLRRAPGFTAVAVLTLAIGIGASTALFTALDAILLRALPVPEPGRLVYLASGTLEQFSFPFHERLRAAATSFTALSVVQSQTTRNEIVLDAGHPEPVAVQYAGGNFFSTLGVSARLGRAFGPDDDQPGAAQPVVVLSHAFWRGRFAADPAVVGRSLELEGLPATIIGVMPEDFGGFEIGAEPALWAPLQLATQVTGPMRRSLEEGVEWLVLLGRLRDGVSFQQAQAEVSAIFRRQLQDEVARNPNRPPAERERLLNRTLELRPGSGGYVAARSQFRQPLIVLTVAVGVVLAIACTNLAGLLLARGAARQREIAVRAAMGAERGRIVRQLVTESLLLGVLGGGFGWLIAHGGTRLLAHYIAQSGPAVALTPDLRVLGFALTVSLLTGLLFGLGPALRLSRVDLAGGIKDRNQTVVGTRSRLQAVLVVAQVALSVLLLAGAGLFGRTLYNLRSIDLGFSRENLVAFGLDSGRWRPEPAQIVALQQRLLAELETIPGVRGVSLGGFGMLTGNRYNATFTVEGYEPAPGEEMRAAVVFAGPRFFATTGARLLRGREFTLADTSLPPAGAPPLPGSVVIIGEAMARRYFGDADPIGRRITLTGRITQPLEIVGVAQDTRYTRNLREPPPLEFYLPFFGAVRTPTTFYVRSGQDAAAIGADVRRVVARVEPRLGVRDLRPMEEMVDRLLVRERAITELVGFFSGFALLLAALGLYGVLAYGVAQRTREIGVRMALGARLRDVVLLVLRQGMAFVAIGGVIGIAAALAVTRFVAGLLFAVQPADPLTFAAVVGLLGLVALVACGLPARRAGRVDPMVALRAE